VNAEDGAARLFPLEAIEAQLRRCTEWEGAPRALVEAARYALMQGGKRLRPALAWHCAAAVGGCGEASLPAGGAVEMIHAFSLVHDDLPAIDDDDLRRGRPTLHRHAGEGMAILAGDALLAGAFECLVTLPLHQGYHARLAGGAGGGGDGARHADSILRAELLRELAGAASAMIQGQVWDTVGGLPTGMGSEEQLRLIHSNKTGALLLAACRMGAMTALGPLRDAAGERSLGAIDRMGRAVGLMFQIVDDLIDATQSTEHAGKRTGKDQQAGKLTYPGVLGLSHARAEVERLRNEALGALEGLGPAAEDLRTLCNHLADRTR
jgi:geranylgeranyl diphosphate synthase, type II